MAKNHFYWGIDKQPAMPQNAWDKFVGKLEGVPATYDADGNLLTDSTPGYLTGTNDFSQNKFQVRHALDGNAVIYESNFDDADLSLEIIRKKLVEAFNLADNRVTFTTGQVTFAVRPSAFVAYRLDSTIMFRATIFGRLNDTQSVTWAQSLLEVLAYLAANTLRWDGVNG